jgi:hypothetical protein
MPLVLKYLMYFPRKLSKFEELRIIIKTVVSDAKVWAEVIDSFARRLVLLMEKESF